MPINGLSFSEWLESLNRTLDDYYGVRPVNLTEHFLDVELGVAGCSQRILDNATFLCREVLEPIRNHYQKPIRVHDGYRDAGHNRRVGGKPTSWHLFDGSHAAADFHVIGVDLKESFDWIRLESALPFDKVILELSLGVPATIHVQVDCLAMPRRLAYTGGVGDSQNYQSVTVA